MAKVVAFGSACEMCNTPGKTHEIDDDGKPHLIVPMRNVVPMKTLDGRDVYGYVCDSCLGVEVNPEPTPALEGP
jgi:hypothetical protein